MWFSVYDSSNSLKKDLFWLPKILQNLNSVPSKRLNIYPSQILSTFLPFIIQNTGFEMFKSRKLIIHIVEIC